MEETAKLWRAAILCGAIPLALGTAIYGLFYFTQMSWLFLAGLVTVCAGRFAVITGIIMLTLYSVRLSGSGALKANSARIIGGYLLLLAYFPAELMLGTDFVQKSTVIVSNKSSSAIEDVVLIGPYNAAYHLRKPPPGQEEKNRLFIKGDGSVKYEVRIGTKTESGVLFEYITSFSGWSQSAKITIDEKSAVSVTWLK